MADDTPDNPAPSPAPFKRAAWAEITAALLVGLNLVLLGLPGAIFVEPVASVFEQFGKKIPGDAVWPAAIWVSILMPVGFPLAVMQVVRVKPAARLIEKILWGFVGLAAAGLVFSCVLVALSV
jgi:hypothetical protein